MQLTGGMPQRHTSAHPQFNTVKPHGIAYAVILFAGILTLTLSSCGGAGSTAKSIPTSVAPSITTQPANQTMLLNRSAVFSVSATGTAPLLYQWYKNGATIGNANAATYTTPVITTADNNSTYSVTVSNSAGSVTSSVATLYTGPRAPAIGDLRYLQWEQVPLMADIGGQYGGLLTNFGTGISQYASNVVGYPMNIGTYAISQSTGTCNWESVTTGIAPGTNATPTNYSYLFGSLSTPAGQTYSQFLQSIATTSAVVTSMDLEPVCQQIGVLTLSTQQPGEPSFDQRMELVDPANLQSQVAADGAASRIVSAVTFDQSSGKAVLLSYGWQGDTTTAYEAATFIAQAANVLADAEQLANQGYFISAFGGNDTNGYIIIGMRVMGDTTPRPWYAATGIGSTSTNANGNVPQVADPTPASTMIWLMEGTPGAPTYSMFEQ